MKSSLALGVTLIALCASLINATPIRAEPLAIIPNALEKKQTCTNSPTNRNCWLPGYDANTDQYTSWPNTGVIVRKTLVITNTTCNPDGNGERVCLLVDGSLPGPTIIGNWGDTFEITVRNQLQHNGTSIHWHGIRQLNSNMQDGVNGVTECALAPGDTKTYTFRATEYGTTWYHSHFSAQYGDGVLGTMIINGPATANYDIDLGTYAIQDWYYITAYQATQRTMLFGPQTADTILINGTNKNALGTTGTYNNVKLQSGKTHRLRLVNTALDIAARVSLDGHVFTVIAEDFVPVVPYQTNYVLLGIGQRYDVIISANAEAGNYWFRADAEASCFSFARNGAKSIFTYDNVAVADPTSTANSDPPTACVDPKSIPKIARDVPSDTFAIQAQELPLTFGETTVATNNESLVLWTVNGSSMIIDPSEPTLEYLRKGKSSYPSNYNLIEVSPSASWTYWVIQQIIDDPDVNAAPPIPHPIHLHGHDMFVLGNGTGKFDVDQHFSQLTFKNPPRRDVHHLPASGWLVIAYPTDNPGAWLMHCHIAFHVAMGLSVQFLERVPDIVLPAQDGEWANTCSNYQNYIRNSPIYPQDDSGLRKG
ncbi:laccase precursor [Massarina eburnea CBS 473.64]|uniref:laccase n=1 Tax=Massarina eburnea CBS 473.64 TaxID=1395130 RepID=A0A6A6RXG1_9PLEO|nr:laccase precursor [Massarina eburnea CBS 473.64]